MSAASKKTRDFFRNDDEMIEYLLSLSDDEDVINDDFTDDKNIVNEADFIDDNVVDIFLRPGADKVDKHKEQEYENNINLLNESEVEGVMNNYDLLTTLKQNIKWRKKDFSPLALNFPAFQQEENECISVQDCPLDFFSQYLPISFFEDVAMYTNMYAEQNDIRSFRYANADELKDFFALHILMGCLKYPRIDMYWEPDLTIPAFQIMPKRRFFELRSNLHLVNNIEIEKSSDKFAKVRPIYELIRKRLLKLNVEEEVCVDEAIVPFKGRHQTKQYIRGKPYPWGIKVFMLCGRSSLC